MHSYSVTYYGWQAINCTKKTHTSLYNYMYDDK